MFNIVQFKEANNTCNIIQESFQYQQRISTIQEHWPYHSRSLARKDKNSIQCQSEPNSKKSYAIKETQKFPAVKS